MVHNFCRLALDFVTFFFIGFFRVFCLVLLIFSIVEIMLVYFFLQYCLAFSAGRNILLILEVNSMMQTFNNKCIVLSYRK